MTDKTFQIHFLTHHKGNEEKILKVVKTRYSQSDDPNDTLDLQVRSR